MAATTPLLVLLALLGALTVPGARAETKDARCHKVGAPQNPEDRAKPVWWCCPDADSCVYKAGINQVAGFGYQERSTTFYYYNADSLKADRNGAGCELENTIHMTAAAKACVQGCSMECICHAMVDADGNFVPHTCPTPAELEWGAELKPQPVDAANLGGIHAEREAPSSISEFLADSTATKAPAAGKKSTATAVAFACGVAGFVAAVLIVATVRARNAEDGAGGGGDGNRV